VHVNKRQEGFRAEVRPLGPETPTAIAKHALVGPVHVKPRTDASYMMRCSISKLKNLQVSYFTAVTIKNALCWDIKPQFVPHRKHIRSPVLNPAGKCYVRFEVFTAMTMKNAVFWGVMPCALAVISKGSTLRRITKWYAT
jgi:hypothetical protein